MDATICLVFLLVSSRLAYSLMAEADCSRSVTVDKVHGDNCSSETNFEELRASNHTCSSLKHTLRLLSVFPPESCVEVIINEGRYDVEGTVILHRDLYIHGREGHSVAVHLMVKSLNLFQYSLSFRDTGSIRVRNLQFVGSSGVIGFDNVSSVEIANSSFR